MLTLAEIARALGGEISAGQVRAPGPGHRPQDRSLSIRVSETAPDGFVVHSFAGDDANECRDHVRHRLGMPPWQPNGKAGNGHASPGKEMARAMAELRKQKRAQPAAADAEPDAAEPAPRVVATYPYVTADGELLYEVQRLDPKDFRQRRPLPGGGYAYKLGDVQRVFYRLPELLKFPDATVFLCEGEKDTDRLMSLGLIATTISGATKWTKELAEMLLGRDVIVLVDNDLPGADKAIKAAQALHGVAASVRMVLLPNLPDGGDVSDFLDAGNSREQFEQFCLTAAPFDPSAAANAAPPPAEPEPLPFVETWRVNEGVPPRQWGVRDLFPRRNVVLLSGEGAAGKTLLLLQLGIAHALGRDWLGALPEPGPFLYFGAEDETDEIHRRLVDILKHYGGDFPELQGNLHLLTFAGEDAVLGHADRTGLVKPTPLYDRLLKAASEVKPVLIGIDTSADVFAANENDRAQVRQFVGMLRKMAMQANAYIIVNSHPSLTGINSGSGLSGSTGWHNSVRARAYLTTVKTERDEEPDPNLRMLEFRKSNYGPVAKSIALRWDQGVYKPVAGVSTMVKEQTADRLFLAMLDRFNRQGRNASEKAASKNYAPTMFGKEAEAKKSGLRKADFEVAMRRLFAVDQIMVEAYGAPCRGTTRLVARTSAG
jgi:RecA-family ATPase